MYAGIPRLRYRILVARSEWRTQTVIQREWNDRRIPLNMYSSSLRGTEWRGNPEKVFYKYAEPLIYGLPHYRCLGLLFHAFKSFTLFYFVKLSFIFSALLRRSLVSLGQPTQNPPQWRIKIIINSSKTRF